MDVLDGRMVPRWLAAASRGNLMCGLAYTQYRRARELDPADLCFCVISFLT